MLPYLSVDLVWLLRKLKEGDGFQGWHKDFYMGGRITKTIVINVGSKVIKNEETLTLLENDDFFLGRSMERDRGICSKWIQLRGQISPR